jgi:3-dehydroquinate dehydratase-2
MSEEADMPKVLVIHGAGMNMRGKVQTEIFGTMTLPEYDTKIRGFAAELGLEVEIFHSNLEGEVINKLYEANDKGVDAAIFNPAGFSIGYPALVAAIAQVKFPTIEVHISNPVRRGPVSDTAKVSQGVVTGFAVAGYELALRGIRALLAAKK